TVDRNADQRKTNDRQQGLPAIWHGQMLNLKTLSSNDKILDAAVGRIVISKVPRAKRSGRTAGVTHRSLDHVAGGPERYHTEYTSHRRDQPRAFSQTNRSFPVFCPPPHTKASCCMDPPGHFPP